MALERKDNDEQMEKLRIEADDVAAKVCFPRGNMTFTLLMVW